ncbi:hypothetical protein [Mucilaginibacter sp. CSA2-8R]|uniref:hypothetical protein n=1 Tax=Mucilaginibacter sp. CSA2-8R TaxID=3141542 RepID=UPI00315C6503
MNLSLKLAAVHLAFFCFLQLLLKGATNTIISDALNQFRSAFKQLDDNEKSDDDGSDFAIYFNQVHYNFLGTLPTSHQDLQKVQPN